MGELFGDIPRVNAIRSNEECIPKAEDKVRDGKVQETFTLDDITFGENASRKHRRAVVRLLERYKTVWEKTAIGKMKVNPFKINVTGDASKLRAKPSVVPAETRQEINAQIDGLLKAGAIEESDGSHVSRLVTVRKPNGELRLCVDFRALNSIIESESYPLPTIRELVAELAASRYFISLDLKSGFHQILAHPSIRKYLGFVTMDGSYTFRVMPFGIKTCPSVFQRTMSKTLSERLHKGIIIYIDDIVLHGASVEEVLELLEWTLMKFVEKEVYLNLKKSSFLLEHFRYLGLHVSQWGLRPDPQKIEALLKTTIPKTRTELKSWLGLISYLRPFIAGFAARCASILKLLSKDTPYILEPIMYAEFDDMKTVLTREPVVLSYPRKGGEWVIDTDASTVAVGAILFQRFTHKIDELHNHVPEEVAKTMIGMVEHGGEGSELVKWTTMVDRVAQKTDLDERTRGIDVPNNQKQQLESSQKTHRASYIGLEACQGTWVTYLRVIEYFSMRLSKTQRNWPIRDIECYAIVASLEQFKGYLWSQQVIVYTDHRSLEWIMSATEGRIGRWSVLLSCYDLAVHYRRGDKTSTR